MGRLLDKLKHTCPRCRITGFPLRITGHYNNHQKNRIYLWECNECNHIWKDKRIRGDTPKLKGREHAIMRRERWVSVASEHIDNLTVEEKKRRTYSDVPTL